MSSVAADCSHCDLKLLLKPATMVIKIGGFGVANSTGPLRCLYRCYTVFICSLVSFTIVRQLCMTDWTSGIATISPMLSLSMWFCQDVCTAITLLRTQRGERIKQLKRMLNDFGLDQMLHSSSERRSTIRKSRVFYVGVTIVASVVVVANTLPFAGVAPGPVPTNIFFVPNTDYFMIPLVTLTIVLSSATQLTYLQICLYLSGCWRSFGKTIQFKYSNGVDFEHLTDWCLEKYRQLLEVSTYVNKTFGFYVTAQLGFTVPMFVLNCYIIALPYDMAVKLGLVTWLLQAVMQISVICYAATINVSSIRIKDIFFGVYVEHVSWCKKHVSSGADNQPTSAAVWQRAETLLSRLENRNIGITACDLTLLNKTFFLSLLSVVFNYFFLLVQFALTDDSRHRLPQFCNCTAECPSNIGGHM